MTEAKLGDLSRLARPPTPTAAELKPIVEEPELITLHRVSEATTHRRLLEFQNDEELETIAVGGSYPEVTSTSSFTERELALVRDWDPEEDAVFSYGGPPDLSYDTDPLIQSLFPVLGVPETTLQTLGEKV